MGLRRDAERPASRYCVLKRQDGNAGIPRMRLVDYQSLEPETDFLAGMLPLALRRSCAAENLCALDHSRAGIARPGHFRSLRPVSAQAAALGVLVPRRRSGHCRVACAAEAWNPSSYDGDASFD